MQTKLASVTNYCTKVLADERGKFEATYSKKWHYNFCPENGGSIYIYNRLHGVTYQHAATLTLTAIRKKNLTRKTTALYISIFIRSEKLRKPQSSM